MTCPYCTPGPDGVPVFYPDDGLILLAGKEYKLPPRKVEILRILARHRGHFVHRDPIIAALGLDEKSEDSETLVAAHVSQLRPLLPPCLGIEGRTGVGYRLMGAIEVRHVRG